MTVTLSPYGADDFALLEAQNAPEMTAYLGGPESAEALRRRHERYLRLMREGAARMFRITSAHAATVGTIGWWHATWRDQDVLETGWAILPDHQGHGYATDALRLLVRDAAEAGDRPLLLARPRTDNAASNAVCARAGFSFRGEEDDEYPRGNPIRANMWTFDLAALRRARDLGYDG